MDTRRWTLGGSYRLAALTGLALLAACSADRDVRGSASDSTAPTSGSGAYVRGGANEAHSAVASGQPVEASDDPVFNVTDEQFDTISKVLKGIDYLPVNQMLSHCEDRAFYVAMEMVAKAKIEPFKVNGIKVFPPKGQGLTLHPYDDATPPRVPVKQAYLPWSWGEHTAVTITYRGEHYVLDPAASSQPRPLKDWVEHLGQNPAGCSVYYFVYGGGVDFGWLWNPHDRRVTRTEDVHLLNGETLAGSCATVSQDLISEIPYPPWTTEQLDTGRAIEKEIIDRSSELYEQLTAMGEFNTPKGQPQRATRRPHDEPQDPFTRGWCIQDPYHVLDESPETSRRPPARVETF